jgi:TolB-like protein
MVRYLPIWLNRSLLGLALACTAGGCGYSTVGSEPVGGYQWHSLYPEDVKTIAVPIFTNKSFRRNEEFQLTKALITQIESKTQYKVVARERADTILEGEIKSIDVRRVSDSVLTAVPQENLYVVVVDFSWKDQRTGRIRVQRQNFEQDTTFYPTLGEGEFVGSQQAAEKLASGIVEQLQADW